MYVCDWTLNIVPCKWPTSQSTVLGCLDGVEVHKNEKFSCSHAQTTAGKVTLDFDELRYFR